MRSGEEERVYSFVLNWAELLGALDMKGKLHLHKQGSSLAHALTALT